jgi:hypothetical protein
MGEFTPGPWDVCASDSDHFSLISANVQTTQEPKNGGIYIAKVQGPDTSANAHLIAAAPELYEALEYVRANLGDPVPVGRRHVARVVDAALAKARGETASHVAGGVNG